MIRETSFQLPLPRTRLFEDLGRDELQVVDTENPFDLRQQTREEPEDTTCDPDDPIHRPEKKGLYEVNCNRLKSLNLAVNITAMAR